MKRLLRIGIPSLALVAAGALALPAVRAAGSAGCQPGNWMEWHLAMRQQCLEPRFVCEHMTSAEMLRDPQIAAAWREGIAAGRPEPARGLSQMVGHVRAAFGCEPEAGVSAFPAEAFPAERLPPGHPPIGGEWSDVLPPGHPPVGGDRSEALPPGHPPLGGTDALPPGHPPLGGTCPFGGSGAGRAQHPAGPLPFTFEQPETTTL